MNEQSEPAVGALRRVLGAEHAAVWVYGLASAYATEQRVSEAIEQAREEHERSRDAAERALRGAGQQPPTAAAAYDVGREITDQTSAIQTLLTAEHDCQVGWRSVLENAGGATRRIGLHALTTSATRATRWRLTIGETPAAEQFPGQP